MEKTKLEKAKTFNSEVLASECPTLKSDQTKFKDKPITIGYGPFRAKGPLSCILLGAVGGAVLYSITLAVKAGFDKKAKNNTSANKIVEDRAKSINKITEHHEASKDRMAEDNNRTDNKIRLAQAKADIRREERVDRTSSRIGVMSSSMSPLSKESLGMKLRAIHNKVGLMPDCSAIPFLNTLIKGCPDGYKDAILLSLLSAFGALGFSKVRAPYIDGKNHSPSLQTIIEGAHGSGKGKIQHIYNVLFSRIIEGDSAKLRLDKENHPIIQTAGINISSSKYFDIVAANKGLHTYAMETEIQAVTERFKKKGGLSFDYLRKALYNEPIYQNSKASGAATGSFPVYFNYTFTGTPNAVATLITPNEIEGGTAARICFGAIPEIGKDIPTMDLPTDNELETMRNQIDAWRGKYCFQTINGSDIPCSETTIDLGYINTKLKEWLGKQYDMSQSEGCATRNDERARMATIAFHAAIVLHMLAGNPGPEKKEVRRAIKKLTIYIADICMERYLQKFTTMGAQVHINSTSETPDEGFSPTKKIQLTPEQDERCYNLKESLDEYGNKLSWGVAANRMGLNRDTFRNAYNRHVKRKQCLVI